MVGTGANAMVIVVIIQKTPNLVYTIMKGKHDLSGIKKLHENNHL